MPSENYKPASPFYEELNLLLPRERVEVNAWARHYYSTHPIIALWLDAIVNKVNSGFVILGSDADAYKKALINDRGESIYAMTIKYIISELNVIGEAISNDTQVGEGAGHFEE